MAETNAKTIDTIKRLQSAISGFENRGRFETTPRTFTVVMAEESFRLIAGKQAGRLLELDGFEFETKDGDKRSFIIALHTSKGYCHVLINDGMGDLIEVL